MSKILKIDEKSTIIKFQEKWIAENNIRRAEAEQIAQQTHKNYFLRNILENVLNREINEDLEDPIFSDDKKEE